MSPARLALPAALLATALACTPFVDVRDEMVEMRDGTHLATDVYLPEGDGPWPTLLVRTPYGKGIVGLAAPRFARQGLAVVAQDMRGRYASEGIDPVFITDDTDGYDTVAWLTDQGWSDGTVASYGASALGIVQYAAAPTAPEGLVAVMPTVATPSFYEHAIFHGGVFRQGMIEGWLQGQGSTHFLDDIAAHPFEDDFWAPVQTAPIMGQVQAAGLHVGGWFDIFPQGPIDAFTGYQERGGDGARGAQHLIMGPWTHGGIGQTVQGDLVFPASAANSPITVDDATDALIHGFLDPADPATDLLPEDLPVVQYYVMGENTWRTAGSWPPDAAPVRLHLQPDGSLSEACPGSGDTAWVYDPEDPAPTVCGGNLLIRAGSCDQRTVEARDDVVVFDTGDLAEPLEVTGRVRAHLFVDLDQPDTDLVVLLTDVYPDGRSMLVAEGAARVAARGRTDGLDPLEPGEVVESVVDLFSTSMVFQAGHRLRVSVSSSSVPRYEPSRNNGLPWPETRDAAASPVTVRLHHETGAASYLEIPVPQRAGEDIPTCEG